MAASHLLRPTSIVYRIHLHDGPPPLSPFLYRPSRVISLRFGSITRGGEGSVHLRRSITFFLLRWNSWTEVGMRSQTENDFMQAKHIWIPSLFRLFSLALACTQLWECENEVILGKRGFVDPYRTLISQSPRWWSTKACQDMWGSDYLREIPEFLPLYNQDVIQFISIIFKSYQFMFFWANNKSMYILSVTIKNP